MQKLLNNLLATHNRRLSCGQKGIQDNTKNGSTNLVPLSPQVLKILSARNHKKESKEGWVFPSTYNRTRGANQGRSKSTKEARKKLKQLSGVQDWTAHDLRRTARTLMSRLKIKHHIRERVLNHAQGGVQGVYDQHDYLQEKADALNKLGREIDRILGVETKNKIVDKDCNVIENGCSAGA